MHACMHRGMRCFLFGRNRVHLGATGCTRASTGSRVPHPRTSACCSTRAKVGLALSSRCAARWHSSVDTASCMAAARGPAMAHFPLCAQIPHVVLQALPAHMHSSLAGHHSHNMLRVCVHTHKCVRTHTVYTPGAAAGLRTGRAGSAGGGPGAAPAPAARQSARCLPERSAGRPPPERSAAASAHPRWGRTASRAGWGRTGQDWQAGKFHKHLQTMQTFSWGLGKPAAAGCEASVHCQRHPPPRWPT